jgi:outer membrane immunogenic protein
MKRVFLVTVAVIGLAAGSAAGADLPARMYKAAPPPLPACAQFGGFYIGGQVGWAHYDHTWNDRDAWSAEEGDDGFEPIARANLHVTDNGFLGGVQGGWNWQFNCTVFGFEADYNWASINASTLETDGEGDESLDTLSLSSKLRGFGTLRTRTGIVVDNLLLYVTGGLAVADFKRSYTLTSIDPEFTETFEHSRTRWGWTAGFGSEWAITPNWSLKSEVLYARFEKDEQTFICTHEELCTDGPESKRFDHHDSIWTTRIGLNYRFGGFGAPFGKGPVVAKY